MCFADQLHRNVEAYVDDMVIKIRNPNDLITNLEETFSSYVGFGGSSTQLNAFSEYHQGNCSGSSSATEELKPIL
jgi:hypothetical protein